jgi:cell division protein FtsL
MAYYSSSSNAYDFTLFEESFDSFDKESEPADDRRETEDGGTQQNKSRRNDRRAESDAKVKRMRRRKSNIAGIALGVIFGIAVAFIVASIIHGQVQLTELNQQISDAKAQLAEQQSVYTQLEMKVDSSISTTVVEDYAKNNLSMSKATNSQKEFVQLSDTDKAEVTLSKDKNIFETIAESFSSLWSLFGIY